MEASRLWASFFLDEQLGLNHHDLTPKTQEYVTRLCSYMLFEGVAKVFMELTGAQVSQSTAHRCTLEIGEIALEGENKKGNGYTMSFLIKYKEPSIR